MFKLFKKDKIEEKVIQDYGCIKVDMHSHVLPGIDDGAKNVEESIYLIKQMLEVGIKKIIATPHIIADIYRNTPEIISGALKLVQDELLKQNIEIVVEAAAEHFFDETFEKRVDNNTLMVIKGGYVLFEFSFIVKPLNAIAVIQKIIDNGYTPVLAHPERYRYLTLNDLQNLRSWGCNLQLNTISLTGYYGAEVKKTAELLVDNQMVDFISSDMHHQNHAIVFRQALLMPYLNKLMESNYPLKNKYLL